MELVPSPANVSSRSVCLGLGYKEHPFNESKPSTKSGSAVNNYVLVRKLRLCVPHVSSHRQLV